MIPKIIHYCWFGKGEKPELALRCIESWKKYCPDYQIIEWNEDNFDININKYCREAYENRKYAFVSDIARLYAMYTIGGIYMDTDVELVKNLDDLLDNIAFSGFETDECIPTGIMASEKGFELFGEFFNYYQYRSFIKSDGSMDTTTNVIIMTNIMEKYGLIKNGKKQTIKGFTLYPKDYFCPLDDSTGVLEKTKNTYAIHWFSKSWMDKKTILRSKITKPFHRVFGKNCFDWLKKFIK